MTPRVGVKTTLTTERAFSGAPGPKREPHFFVGLDDSNGLNFTEPDRCRCRELFSFRFPVFAEPLTQPE